MQANIARYATRLQYAYSELSKEDHALVGPDALDVALWAMTSDRKLGTCCVQALDASALQTWSPVLRVNLINSCCAPGV